MEGESVLDTEVLDIGICGWQLVDDFDAGLGDTRWVTKDDAYWEPRGWIEMTGMPQPGRVRFSGRRPSFRRPTHICGLRFPPGNAIRLGLAAHRAVR